MLTPTGTAAGPTRTDRPTPPEYAGVDNQFILAGLLRCSCGTTMGTATRGSTRMYHCPACRRLVDAIGVETEVWQRITRAPGTPVHPHTPYPQRQQLLAAVLRHAQLGAAPFHVRLRRHPTAGNGRHRDGGLDGSR